MRIVVAGGGTAGWLMTLIISKLFPQHKLTVIESTQIGIIGTGESSTGMLADVISDPKFGIDLERFVKECDGTAKYGIKHIGWNKDPSKHYYGPIAGTETQSDNNDLIFYHAVANLPLEQRHIACEHGVNIEENTCSIFDDPKLNVWHFDTHKLGRYLRTICENVTHIDTVVNDVELDPHTGYITKLHCADGQTVEGDFFVDATGFKKVLMNKLGAKWKSYKDNLPVNSAIPFILPYDDDELIEPVTTAWAQSAGWCWMIPTNERYGCGYVFDENHISADQAHAEIEQALGKKIDPIKQIHFESGRQQDLWIKNCVSIGLAAAFAEPLEATSIHTTLTQILDFIENRLKDTVEETCDPKVIQDYNTFCGNVYDNMKEFLVAHYICGRVDSDFWRNITAGNTITPFVKDIVELAKHRVPTKTMFPVFTGSAGWPLWCWVLSGTGAISSEVAKKELEIYNAEQYASEKFMENYNMHMHNALYLPKNDTFIRSLGMTI